MLTDLLWTAIFGLAVGAIAKFIMPGRDPGGILITMLIGIAGSFIGTVIGRILLLRGPYYQARWVMSILGALLLLWIYRMVARRASV
jgi:uncharacterized membrane protein YeaQ/YmgE (transglycosylase-associated protein family)